MTRAENLTVIRGGLSRNRLKGAALKDALYELWDGYVTSEKTVKARPGSIRQYKLPAGTKGLCSFGGSLHVFGVEQLTVPNGVTLHVIQHPAGLNSDGSNVAISKIHFAAPYLGALYVVAEFEEAVPPSSLGSVFHFWLRVTHSGGWEANTAYQAGDIIEVDGVGYEATRFGPALPAWSARAPRQVGDRIEPTTYNGFYYEVIDVQGVTPVSGDTEPSFPASAGATIVEYSEKVVEVPEPVVTTPSTTPSTGQAVSDRYGQGIRAKFGIVLED